MEKIKSKGIKHPTEDKGIVVGDIFKIVARS